MPNRLAAETSPYLLQHADNPVDWYPWGDEAFELARQQDKPVLLSVGYSACHWCHVMAHESFEDEATAEVMNELFVNVKVDREERPGRRQDLPDRAAAADPANRRLAADDVHQPEDRRPFFGGTYFPNEARYGMPAFSELLRASLPIFASSATKCAARATKLTDVFGRLEPTSGSGRHGR